MSACVCVRCEEAWVSVSVIDSFIDTKISFMARECLEDFIM